MIDNISTYYGYWSQNMFNKRHSNSVRKPHGPFPKVII